MAKKDKKIKKDKSNSDSQTESQAIKAAESEQVKSPKSTKKPKKDKKALKLGHEKPRLTKAQIEKRIVTKIEAETKTTIEIGTLLEEAKFYFYEGKKLQGTEHVEWATEQFGFARAQTYKYIKIGKVFGSMDGFDGVPMGVLAVMSSDDKILKAALQDMKQARKDKDIDFKIDNIWLKEYNHRLEAERTLALESKEELTLEQELEQYSLEQVRELFEFMTGEKAGKKQEKGLRAKIAEYEAEIIERAIFDIEGAKKKEQEANAKVSKVKYDKVEAELKELRAKAKEEEELHAVTLTKLQEAQEHTGEGGNPTELLNARDKALHSLMSKQSPHVLLGIKEGSPKREINKAKRALEAVYSPKHDHGCESIWLLVEAAVEKMSA